MDAQSVSDIREHIAPLIIPDGSDELAKRFDYMIYSVDLALLQSKDATKVIRSIVQTAEDLSNLYNIPQVKEQKYIIEKVQTDEFWENVTVFELEAVREALRELIKFIQKNRQKVYYTNFTDEILEVKEGTAIYNSNNLKHYKKKVEFYLKEHDNMLAIYKLRTNKKLTESDLKELENVLWNELGTKTDYVKEFGDTPIGRLVRKIVGLDREAVNEAFSEFLSEEKLNVNQIRFVKLIVDYVVKNGMIENKKVFMDEPFRSVGSITSLFKDKMDIARQIMDVVDEIKKNSEEIA